MQTIVARLSRVYARHLLIAVALLIVLPCLAPPRAVAADEFLLTQDGKPLVEIVYQAAPSDYPIPPAEQRQRFAECLADFVRVIKSVSGAELTATQAADAPGRAARNTIQIGATPAAVQAGLVAQAAKLKPHAFIIRSDPQAQTLYLLGSTLEGTGHAMYELLETLGCR